MSQESIRVAVLGAGFFGATLARGAQAHPDFEVCQIADLDAAGAATLAREVGAEVIAVNQIAAAEVDLVFIATPNHTHAAAAIEVLNAGRHVFVEKPLTVTAADARAVLEAAQASDGVLVVGHIERALPGIKALHAAVRAGDVGTLTEGYAARTRLVHLPADAAGWWKLDRARSGGELLHEIHELDLLVWIFGEPTVVRCTGGAPQDHASDQVDSVHSTTLKFASGAVAHHLLSTTAHRAEWCLRVTGTEAAVEVDLRAGTVTTFVDGAITTRRGVFDDEEANASLRESATAKQRYNQPGAASPLWMQEAVRLELDEVAAAVRGQDSVLLAAPAAAVLAAVAAESSAAESLAAGSLAAESSAAIAANCALSQRNPS